VFTGIKLSPEDFDALAEYVELFKKQFMRKLQLGPLADIPVGAIAGTNED